jgi:hypothetical protein
MALTPAVLRPRQYRHRGMRDRSAVAFPFHADGACNRLTLSIAPVLFLLTAIVLRSKPCLTNRTTVQAIDRRSGVRAWRVERRASRRQQHEPD